MPGSDDCRRPGSRAVQFNSVSARLKRAGMERSNASFVARAAEGDVKAVRLGQRIWIDPSAGAYDISMTSFRTLVTVLAVIHAVFAGLTALLGAFANGGDVWQRLLVILLHPLGAAGVLLLVLRPRLTTTTILALVALLTANVIADLRFAQLMAAGRVLGDWELALTFSVVPAIGIVYALALLRTARGIAG